ncbi:MAG: cytochrome c-type biosis protein CcmF [Euryarchaeota archaeon]|nr:cytochrome c-type biosis protein CcmF [Euryarchaeota archaeon]
MRRVADGDCMNTGMGLIWIAGISGLLAFFASLLYFLRQDRKFMVLSETGTCRRIGNYNRDTPACLSSSGSGYRIQLCFSALQR